MSKVNKWPQYAQILVSGGHFVCGGYKDDFYLFFILFEANNFSVILGQLPGFNQY